MHQNGDLAPYVALDATKLDQIQKIFGFAR
jgi:hypothetical protein